MNGWLSGWTERQDGECCVLRARLSRAPRFYDWHGQPRWVYGRFRQLPSTSWAALNDVGRRSSLNGCNNNALFYYRMWVSLSHSPSYAFSLYLSLSSSFALYLSLLLYVLFVYICGVWRASAVDRKILISPRFGACSRPPADRNEINCLAICNTFMAILCVTFFTLTLTIWLWRRQP